MGKIRKDFCPNSLQPFLENIDRRSCNDGSRELTPIFLNSHGKSWPSPSAVARTLEYLVGVPSKTVSSGKGKNRFGSMSKNTSNNLSILCELILSLHENPSQVDYGSLARSYRPKQLF